MGLQLFSNNASATLAANISSTATSMSVTSGEGALFPALSGGNWFVATLMMISGGSVTALEIVQVTARSTDTMTIVRAQEGTTAQAWNAGTTVALLPTAGGLSEFVQSVPAQAQSYNYAADVGSANAYSITLTPAIAAHVVGMPIRWLAAHANTGASTFNDGAGVGNLVAQGGGALAAGSIIAGGLYTVIWDGAAFELQGAAIVGGSFTPSWTGFSVAPSTGAIPYSVNGSLVSIFFPSGLHGTSNSTFFIMSGLPAAIQPASTIYLPFFCLEDNSTPLPGGMVEVSGGSITFLKDGTGVGGWTASGGKGIYSVYTPVLTYPIH